MVLSAGSHRRKRIGHLKNSMPLSESGKQLLGIILEPSVSAVLFLRMPMENTGEFPVYASALTRIGEKSGISIISFKPCLLLQKAEIVPWASVNLPRPWS